MVPFSLYLVIQGTGKGFLEAETVTALDFFISEIIVFLPSKLND